MDELDTNLTSGKQLNAPKPESPTNAVELAVMLTPVPHRHLSRHCHSATAEREMERRVVDPLLQREKVQQALNAAELKPRATYYIISQKWWSAWRDYVACDKKATDGTPPGVAGTQSVEALSLDDSRSATIPGPITNEPLCEALAGSAQPLLRQGLVELDDYAVIPKRAWEMLAEWYGGGPALPRRVVAMADPPGEPYVEVQLLRVEVRNATDDGLPGPKLSSGIIELSRADTVAQAREEVLSVANPPGGVATRIWVKPAAVSDVDGTGNLSEHTFWRPAKSTDGAYDSWELLAVSDDQSALATCKSVAAAREALRWGALVEAQRRPTTPYSSASWPLATRERWRDSLKEGDVIDACDSEGRWFDSVITEVGQNGRVKVHYKGWGDKWDTWLDRYDTKSIQRLFTHTDDWRKLRVGDSCEVRSEDPDKALWYEAHVVAVHNGGDVVEVRVHHMPNSHATQRHETSSEHLSKSGTHINKQRAYSRLSSTQHVSSSSVGGDSSNLALTSRGTSSYSPPCKPHVRGTPPAPGAVGLTNLGNTCFLNSMLQCLSHTVPLTTYFRKDDLFIKELNVENPLGSGGSIARAYADFVRDAWSGQYSIVVPNALKRAIGKHAPQFSGYQQQDSQELMNYVLDGLHEDLNRVRVKPYTETLESNGRPDEEVAEESWRRFQQRNQSIIVDICYGQLRSHITCPLCKHESITFDPYLSLSLPLPSASTRQIIITFVALGTSRPVKYSVAIGARETVATLKGSLLNLAFGSAHDKRRADVDICDVWANRIHKTFTDAAAIDQIKQKDDLVAYELEPTQGRQFVLDVVFSRHAPDHRESVTDAIGGRGVASSVSKFGSRQPLQLFGAPLRLAIDETISCNELRDKIAHRVSRFTADLRLRRQEDNNDKNVASEPPYRILISTFHETRKGTLELPHDETPVLDVVRRTRTSERLTLMLEWSLDAIAEMDNDVHAVDIHETAARRGAGTRSGKSTNRIDILDCLRKLAEREQLGETEQWYCSKCKQHSRAFKKLDLWSTPEILIVHLKRFQYAQNTYFVHRQKLDDLVEFPLKNLDLSEFVLSKNSANQAVYDLFSVSEHSGGLGGGHYTATVLDEATQQWFHFNDSIVTRAEPSTVVSQQAYVLFYRRSRRKQA